MSPHDELDLDQIDALLGEDFSEDDDLLGEDFSEDDDLLGADDDDFDDLLGGDDDEEDSLDELLGAIDEDYLSEKEQVFLQNKSFLDSHNPVQLDKFFMEFQETLYGAMCDYAGESEEHFGADSDEIQDMEIEIDSLGGHCFGSDEEAEDFIAEFGAVTPLTVVNTASQSIADATNPVAAVSRQAIRKAKRAQRRARRMSRRQARRLMRARRRRNRGVWLATKRRYIRQLRKLTRCTRRFNKLAAKVSPNIAIKILAGKNKFLARPFTTLALAAEGNTGGIQAILSAGAFKAKDRRLARVANRCDRKLQMLRRIYTKMAAKGRVSGIQRPRVAFRSILNQLTMKAKSASKKSGGLIKAAAVAAAPTAVALPAVQRKTAAELAKIRAAEVQAKLAARKELTLAKLQAAREAIAEQKSEAKAERQELSMVASNPYMDQADMLALDRARQDRMAQSAQKRQALIQAKERQAKIQAMAEAKRQAMAAKRKALLIEAQRKRQMMLSKPKVAAPIVTKGPASLRKPVLSAKSNANLILKRRIETTEKQLAAATAAHRNSLQKQMQFAKGSTPYNAQYQKTKAFAQKSSQLRAKLAELKAGLK